MLKFNHVPAANVESIAQHYSDKDGVPVHYVCTTALEKYGIIAYDVFYRPTPHPEFGNRYFGVALNPLENSMFITNADHVTDYVFTCGYDTFGALVYSQHRHDMIHVQGGEIDGGRAYTKITGTPFLKVAAIKCGQMIAVENCSKCGKNWSDLLEDTLYPQKRDMSEWVYGCMYHNGGCGRQVYGSSMLDAVQRWNVGEIDEFMT